MVVAKLDLIANEIVNRTYALKLWQRLPSALDDQLLYLGTLEVQQVGFFWSAPPEMHEYLLTEKLAISYCLLTRIHTQQTQAIENNQ